jgi:pilus assembly protein Flp/PilA
MSFIKDENGQGMVEYALIVALIAIVVIAALLILGPKIKSKLTDSADQLDATAAEDADLNE